MVPVFSKVVEKEDEGAVPKDVFPVYQFAKRPISCCTLSAIIDFRAQMSFLCHIDFCALVVLFGSGVVSVVKIVTIFADIFLPLATNIIFHPIFGFLLKSPILRSGNEVCKNDVFIYILNVLHKIFAEKEADAFGKTNIVSPKLRCCSEEVLFSSTRFLLEGLDK